ncbi:quinolinate synthase NadA [Carboxylicivirga litoralis]|uniref:quinolinate synthase NadA n=1 Tax=Carboxylicivirga litoralis TaxID=2816963 RepID=UPI0021CB47A9|nr:quinolinate synthase NadA [Carboxylicivirga sp. A043]
MNIKDSWLKSGYVDEPVPTDVDIVKEITRLKKEKDAIIMAHFYQTDEIQDIADFVGDSLALAQEAAKTDAKIIVLAGVHFMGETAKILSPDKLVLVPDLNAGCSLADSCPPEKFKSFVEKHPDHTVLTYVNTTAKIKALSDIVVTSTNAKNVVDSLPKNEKIIFGPDRNLGNYLNSISGREMVLWDGACHVHEKFSVEKIVELKKEHPEALVLAHPECKKPLLLLADYVGSTAALLKYSINNEATQFIVATESGIIHQMQKESPNKEFIPAPPNDSTCACNDCEYMKLNSLEKLYNALKYEWPSIDVDEDIRNDAVKPINRMLDISKKAGL